MTDVEVLLDTESKPQRVGTAHFTRSRGQVSTTFLYDPAYLASGGPSIDPSLRLDSGVQYSPGLLRAFADTAPDRWGRNLIAKAERIRAREVNRTPRRLDEVDYLLGVSDNTRQGALRFRLLGQEEYLGEPSTVPRLVSLPHLLTAADQVQADDDPAAAIKQLLDTGTTGLGGARPKASVLLDDGGLAIAKFPHASDRWNAMAWEAVMLDLMQEVGIRCPQRRLVGVGERGVLVLRRFDRSHLGHRIGYISAMTATQGKDGEQYDYLDVVDSIRDLSRSPRSDLRELFVRAVFSVGFGNTDDHLRNHGFLMDRRSWRLSPVFDVNPNPELAAGRATSIVGADVFPDEAEALLALAEDCGLANAAAREVMARVARLGESWRDRARASRIPDREIALMADAIAPRIEALAALANQEHP
ncbi:MAG: type II toxin-antitoxin system HipA family toxin [Actinomyces succiniciruminis]|nr:type II toxin-antitoxin system HipA family toxin [Actinomyces succiniciruminis]